MVRGHKVSAPFPASKGSSDIKMTQRGVPRLAAVAQSLVGCCSAHWDPEGAAERGCPPTAFLTADPQALQGSSKRCSSTVAGCRGPLPGCAAALLHTHTGVLLLAGVHCGVLPLSLHPRGPFHGCCSLAAFGIGLYLIQPLDLMVVGPLRYFLCWEVACMLCRV